ncbi:MAG: Translation initiation factor 2 GTPase [Candidatus Methanohalarchaeum thermophilum]|uniref:Probable translation initiation factor IF-2 n=1 Tax=Methanohalarchaeum thermophilum TaxID=1903181 RepID=A0A1Q6DS18_METT1|nr:MAG: Translation initiation factor 2 GTPase [Candidatus Methanohalarchaeum thermophilum]
MSGIRTPIVCLLGHVDHGKTTTLDKIRGSAVAEREAGAITQHIGATEVPLDIISKVSGDLVKKDKFKVPGLLFIDTPGHHAFTSLRSRGGSLADIAVLLVDVTDGFQPQTHEAIDILQDFQTPFIVAANKIDKIPGWKTNKKDVPFRLSYKNQEKRVKEDLDNRIYEIVGKLHDKGFNSDRYDRLKNFKDNVGVVPVSAKTGEGIPDLLMVLIGLAQRYLETELEFEEEGPGEGTVLEVKEEKGLGKTLDVILYDGLMKTGDSVLIGRADEPVETKIRALLKPNPMEEIRESGSEFSKVDEVRAAAGIKVAAPDLGSVRAGFPIRVIGDRDTDSLKEEMKSQVEDVVIRTEESGIIVKADTIGSLEAVIKDLEDSDISIRRADIGSVSRRDIIEANTIQEPLERAILAFDVDILPEARKKAEKEGIQIFNDDVIYRLIEDYQEWIDRRKKLQKEKRLENIIRPGKIKILIDHVFRRNDPAIVGVRVLSTIKSGYPLMNQAGERIGQVKEIQDQGENVEEANPGDEVAVSIRGPTVGRQIEEGEELYVDIPEKHAEVLKTELKDSLTEKEEIVFQEIIDIKRKENKYWAI